MKGHTKMQYYFLGIIITLEMTEGAIKNGQSRETGNRGRTRRRNTNQSITQYVLDTTMRKQTQTT
jgi:hypothetical protein